MNNEYAKLLPYFDRIPKTVLAAIAVSLATSGGDRLEEAAENVALEWSILCENGIVPQKLPADVRKLAAAAVKRKYALFLP